ncbi:MAG: TlpA family protein disulfide reductase [Fibrobacterales bacterium]
MKFIVLLIAALLTTTVSAQRLPVEVTGPIPEIDKNGIEQVMNFKVPLAGISDQGLKFDTFKNRPLFIFYFSAKCPHCVKTFPKIQKVSDEFTAKGLTTIAVAVSGNKKSDIRSFMRDVGVRVPMLQDKDRKFSDAYGTGSVPLGVLVLPDGHYIRYKNMGAEIEHLKNKLNDILK